MTAVSKQFKEKKYLLLLMPMNNKQFLTSPALLGKHYFCTKYHHLTPTTATLYKW